MLLLNFAHPITEAQLARIAELTGKEPKVIEVPTHFDHDRSFPEQVRELVEGIGLSSVRWQTTPLIVNPPGYAPAAVTLLAELHGRIGHFPSVARLRPVPGSTPPEYEVAEIVNLQSVRDRARERR